MLRNTLSSTYVNGNNDAHIIIAVNCSCKVRSAQPTWLTWQLH